MILVWSDPVRRYNFCWSDYRKTTCHRLWPIVYLTSYISNSNYTSFLFLKMSQNFNVKMAGQLCLKQCLKQNTDQLKTINCSKYNRLLWIESFPLNHSQTKPVRSFFESELKFIIELKLWISTILANFRARTKSDFWETRPGKVIQNLSGWLNQ